MRKDLMQDLAWNHVHHEQWDFATARNGSARVIER
jgi:hypothetical protein